MSFKLKIRRDNNNNKNFSCLYVLYLSKKKTYKAFIHVYRLLKIPSVKYKKKSGIGNYLKGEYNR